MLPLPDEIITCISEYSVRSVTFHLREELRGVGSDLISLYLGFGYIDQEELCKWRRVNALFEKYHRYQLDYEHTVAHRLRKGKPVDEHPPLLIDACLSGSGLPCAYTSVSKFDDSVFVDVREIISLVPNSLRSTYGQLRCRNRVTPLHSAIYNESVPIKVIAYLLENGANPVDKIFVDGVPHNIAEDIHGNIPTARIDAVLNLFKVLSL